MDKIIIIDTCSLIDFFKYYTFDLYNEKKVYPKLFGFLIEKIKNGEIILLDKVYNELNLHDFFKKKLSSKDVTSTDFLIEEIEPLIKKYTIEENKEKFNFNEIKIATELNRYVTGPIADLYLVAYSIYLKHEEKIPIIITNETTSKDGKIIAKLPNICKSEVIECKNMAYMLFELYKDELKFDLNIISP